MFSQLKAVGSYLGRLFGGSRNNGKPRRRDFMANRASLNLEQLEDRCVPTADPVADIWQGVNSSNPNGFVAVGGWIYFAAQTQAQGIELWKSNGTQTLLAADINVGAGDSGPSQLTVVGNKIFFSAETPAAGRELWVYDVTTGVASPVKDIYPGASGSWPTWFAVMGGTLYFRAFRGGANGDGDELWKSDGTTDGTQRVKDIWEGANSGNPTNLTVLGGTLYFTANDGATGYELWKSDGTDAGTGRVADINNGPGNGMHSSHQTFAILGGEIYFSATNGADGYELWKSAGTAATTVMVEDIYNNPPAMSSEPLNFITVGNVIYFTAVTAANGRELWKTDGTVAGTDIVEDIWAGPNSSASGFLSPTYFAAIGGTVYFAATDANRGRELWKSDGTDAGTDIVRDINPFGAFSDPLDLKAVGSAVYFSAIGQFGGREPFRTFGTRDSTARVANVNPGGDSNPSGFIAIGNTVFFAATTVATGRELWKTQVPQPQVMGRIWNDADQDGIQDVAEGPYTVGMTVEIYSNLGVFVDSTTTDINGEYAFVVPAGQYYLKFIKPAMYSFSPKDQGSDDTKDSDVDPTSWLTDVFSLIDYQILTNVDAGIYPAQP